MVDDQKRQQQLQRLGIPEQILSGLRQSNRCQWRNHIPNESKMIWHVWWTMLGPSFQFIGSSLSFLHLRLQEWVWLWPVIAALLVREEGGCPWLGRKARKGKWLGLSELTLELGRWGLGVRERDHGSLSFLQRELTCDVHINVYAVLSLHERGCSQN